MVYNKLVRDKIPEIIRSSGEIPVTRVLDQEAYTAALEGKLDEEGQEFHQEHNLEELADILEVVYALAEDLGFSKVELLKVYQNKHDARGGFRDRIYLVTKE